jgi:hypothetical protein
VTTGPNVNLERRSEKKFLVRRNRAALQECRIRNFVNFMLEGFIGVAPAVIPINGILASATAVTACQEHTDNNAIHKS